jgi:hypothetical protein
MLVRSCRWNLRPSGRGGCQGITVDTISPAYKSQFHAASGAPGIRCRKLTESDFSDAKPKSFVVRELQDVVKNTSTLKMDDIVPWEGGEFFVTISNGNLTIANPEINAAQNHHRRFWLRGADSFRLPCAATNGDLEIWYPKSDGVMLRGGLRSLVGGSGYCRLDPTGDEQWTARGITPQEWKTAIGSQDVTEGKADRKTFFRDPSGECVDSILWLRAADFWGKSKKQINRKSFEP